MKFSILILLALSMTACSDSNNKNRVANPPTDGAGTCSLEGTWSRCSSYGGSSTRVVLNVSGSQLHETIENFHSVDGCVGVADENFSFNAEIVLGEVGESTFVAGGTDATISPDVDLFTCGANQPAYTVLKFASDCKQFQTTVGAPVCDPASRSTTIDPDPFVKM